MDERCSSPKAEMTISQHPKMHGSASSKRKMVQKTVIRVKVEVNSELHKANRPPSDSWSWRKYGQKPIKGSPYPRGYYKCSTCKGCSAKKQVERCKTDASILIITYTSTHNHPTLDVLKQQQALMSTGKRPQSTTPPPPSSSPTTMSTFLEQQSNLSTQQNHQEEASPAEGQLTGEEEEDEAHSGSFAQLPLDGNDFFDELEELVPISSSSPPLSSRAASSGFIDSSILMTGRPFHRELIN